MIVYKTDDHEDNYIIDGLTKSDLVNLVHISNASIHKSVSEYYKNFKQSPGIKKRILHDEPLSTVNSVIVIKAKLFRSILDCLKLENEI